MRRFAVLALPMAASLASGTARAQAPRAESRPTFGSDVAVVAMPVFVTDKSGASVSGLKVEDFEVLDEGKPVSIVGFLEVDAASPVTEGGNLPAARAARRQFLLLFDLSFSQPGGLMRARRAALEFLEKSPLPSDLVAVGTLSSQGGFKLLVGFTPDRAQAGRAIQGLGLSHTESAPDPLGLALDLGLPSSAGRSMGADDNVADEEARQQVLLLQRSEQLQYNQRVAAYLQALRQLGTALDSIQGRKQVILLSGGFDDSALVGAQGDAAIKNAQAVTEGRIWEVESDSHFGDAGSRRSMDGMVRAMATSDTVIHTVDLTGLAAGTDAQSQVRGEVRTGTGRESLSQIAHLSGGRLVKDTNDIAGALGEVLAASRHYYVLAFEPASVQVGKFRQLKVRLRAKGLQASHRAGYSPSAGVVAPAVRRLQAAEAIAKGMSGGPIDLQVLAVPYRDVAGKVTVPVVLEADGPSLLDRGPGDELKLEVYAYAFDKQGAIQDVAAVSPTLDLRKVGGRLRQSGLRIQTAFALPEGSHDLRFLLRDAGTGRTGLRRIRIEVPSFAAGQVVLHPPLFMDDPTSWLSLKIASRRNGDPDLPFRVEGDLFAPMAKPRLANGIPSRVCVMAFNGGSLDPKATFEIRSQLLDAGGNTVPLGAVALTKAVMETDGFRRYVLSVTPGTVAPGDYMFRIRLKDPASGAITEADQAVRVE